MKGTTLIIAAVGTIMLVPGCALRAPKAEISADDFDLSPLVGQWSGGNTAARRLEGPEISHLSCAPAGLRRPGALKWSRANRSTLSFRRTVRW